MRTAKKRIFETIATYLPQFIVEERVLNPHLPDVRGQFREGTLVFADISGFTAMSEKLSELGKEGAEELTDILNRYFTHMLNIAFSYRGNQLKFGGDAMLLLFEGNQHAARAVRCALRMQQAMRCFRRVPTSKGTFELKMSIGINSGEFFEASLGSAKQRLHYIFTGREVNRTAEIEAVASAGEIFIGPGTLDELRDRIEIEQERQVYYQVKSLRAHVKSIMLYESNPAAGVSEPVMEMLAAYLPQQLVERIKANAERAGVEGEHRRVTAIFVNLLGASEVITEYGKGQTEEITRVLNDYFLMLQATVDKYGGVVVGCDLNTKGDKLLIIFGAPVAHEDDEERAVRCALEMRQQLADSSLPLKQRIGINSGYVFSGEVGSPSRREYTVMGDHVNLAARLMSVAQEGQIIIGYSTYSMVANRFVVKVQEPIRVKGKSQPVARYQVEGVREESIAHRQLSAGALIGREKEMGVLEATVARSYSGQGQFLAITGAAGTGKSRLVEELRRLWTRRGGSTYTGNCQSYGANTPYLPWIDLFTSFFNLRESDVTEQRRGKIEATMVDLCPGLKDWTAIIGNLLNVSIPESNLLKNLDSKLRRERLLQITLELLLAQAERNHLLLLFEDLHWADSASVELLNYVGRNAKGHPLLVCAVYRPERDLVLEAERQENYTKIVLGELSPESSLDLVRSMVNMHDLPQELSQLVIAKSQGNPFFVEEVVKSLVDAGHLRLDTNTGEYQLVVDLRTVEVPDTVQGIIMARLDQLDEETRNVLRVASVIGRLFQYELVRDIYPRPITDKELLGRLKNLGGLDMVLLEKGEAGHQYYFKHILTQEVAYDSLLFAQRRRLHHKVGEYFEKNYADNIEAYYELLCHHYGWAKDREKALEYSVKAGDKAKRMFSNKEAVEYYHKALQLCSEVAEDCGSLESKVWEALGDIYELTGQYDKALESYQSCQQWYRTLKIGARHQQRKATPLAILLPNLPSAAEKERQIAILCRKRGVIHERKGQLGVALKWFDKGMRLVGEQDVVKARLCTAMAVALFRQGEYSQAQHWCQRGLDIARRVADPDEAAYGYHILGMIYSETGNIDQAIECRYQSLSIYEETNNLVGQEQAHNSLAIDYSYRGNWNKAREHYGKSREIAAKIGDVSFVAIVDINLGEILSNQGNLDGAIESFLGCLRTWERIGFAVGVGAAYSNLGRAYGRQGDWRKALEHLKKGEQIFEQIQSKAHLAEVYQRLAEVYLGLEQPGVAMEYCERALAITLEQKIAVLEGATRRLMSQAYRSLGEWKRAEELLTESRMILEKRGIPYELGQTLWQLALLYHDMEKAGYQSGQKGKIGTLLEEAVAIFKRLGVNFDAVKVTELTAC